MYGFVSRISVRAEEAQHSTVTSLSHTQTYIQDSSNVFQEMVPRKMGRLFEQGIKGALAREVRLAKDSLVGGLVSKVNKHCQDNRKRCKIERAIIIIPFGLFATFKPLSAPHFSTHTANKHSKQPLNAMRCIMIRFSSAAALCLYSLLCFGTFHLD